MSTLLIAYKQICKLELSANSLRATDILSENATSEEILFDIQILVFLVCSSTFLKLPKPGGKQIMFSFCLPACVLIYIYTKQIQCSQIKSFPFTSLRYITDWIKCMTVENPVTVSKFGFLGKLLITCYVLPRTLIFLGYSHYCADTFLGAWAKDFWSSYSARHHTSPLGLATIPEDSFCALLSE